MTLKGKQDKRNWKSPRKRSCKRNDKIKTSVTHVHAHTKYDDVINKWTNKVVSPSPRNKGTRKAKRR